MILLAIWKERVLINKDKSSNTEALSDRKLKIWKWQEIIAGNLSEVRGTVDIEALSPVKAFY